MLQEAIPFWEGLKEQKLMIQQCTTCNRHIFYPRQFCPYDLGELQYIEASGEGKILSYTIVSRSGEPNLVQYLPFVAALIELEEGVKLFSRIRDVDLEQMTSLFYHPVQIYFEEIHEEHLFTFTLKG